MKRARMLACALVLVVAGPVGAKPSLNGEPDLPCFGFDPGDADATKVDPPVARGGHVGYAWVWADWMCNNDAAAVAAYLMCVMDLILEGEGPEGDSLEEAGPEPPGDDDVREGRPICILPGARLVR